LFLLLCSLHRNWKLDGSRRKHWAAVRHGRERRGVAVAARHGARARLARPPSSAARRRF